MNDRIWSGYLELTELYQVDTICHFALNGTIDPSGQDDRLAQSEPCSIRLDSRHILNGYRVIPARARVDLYARTKDGIVWLHDEPAELTHTDGGGLSFDAEAFLSKHLGWETEQTLDEEAWRYRKEHEGELFCDRVMVISEQGIGKCGYATARIFLAPDALRVGGSRVKGIEWQVETIDAELSAEPVMIELLDCPHHLSGADMEGSIEWLARTLDGLFWIRLSTERGDFELTKVSMQWYLTLRLAPTGASEPVREARWLLRDSEKKDALRILLTMAGARSDEAMRGKLAKLTVLGLARKCNEEDEIFERISAAH